MITLASAELALSSEASTPAGIAIEAHILGRQAIPSQDTRGTKLTPKITRVPQMQATHGAGNKSLLSLQDVPIVIQRHKIAQVVV